MIDLDAVIAAEVKGDPIEVKVGKKTYKLRAEMPWETVQHIANVNARAALESVSANGNGAAFADAVLADRPTLEQITARLKAIYATGESSASARSSANGGTRSRPTSRRTTGSTSAAR